MEEPTEEAPTWVYWMSKIIAAVVTLTFVSFPTIWEMQSQHLGLFGFVTIAWLMVFVTLTIWGVTTVLFCLLWALLRYKRIRGIDLIVLGVLAIFISGCVMVVAMLVSTIAPELTNTWTVVSWAGILGMSMGGTMFFIGMLLECFLIGVNKN